MNKVILAGRLTRDPYAGNGVEKFTLAVDRKYRAAGQPDADFITCVAFGKTGEFVGQYLKKGTKVILEGRISTSTYTAKDGSKGSSTDVVVESVEFAESKKAADEYEQMEIDIDDDSLPFN